MKQDKVNQLTQFCRDYLDFSSIESQARYRSITACIIDCVFSLRAQYYSTTIPVVERYAKKYMSGNRFASGDSLSDLLRRIDECGGTEAFASTVLCNLQALSGRRKTEVCYEIADKLYRLLSINTFEDFQNYDKLELLEIVLQSIKGLGDAGINYLFMLAGDANRCKPDVHIHHCIKDAIGEDVSNEQCQELLRGVTAELQDEYPSITVRELDYLIWNKYQIGSRKR